MNQAKVKIFSGTATRFLSEKIVKSYGTELGKNTVLRFSDGEFQPAFDETVRGHYVFIIQSTFMPTDNLFELLAMVDAASRASAYKIAAVIPYFGFARQDRKDRPRVSIGAKLVANLLAAAGVSRIITMDLHADQIQGFFDVPVDHLYASSVFVPYIQSLNLENLIIASPDTGGSKRANAYSKFLNTELVICHKSRTRPNEVGAMTVIGDVKGKNVVLVDDMIDTAGSITMAAQKIMDKGAISVRVIATHGVFSGPAYERIAQSALTEVIVTDSLPVQETEKIKIVTIANLFADVIKKIPNYHSISSNFIF
jgi:ribose-phosphate pyrophosphokinase